MPSTFPPLSAGVALEESEGIVTYVFSIEDIVVCNDLRDKSEAKFRDFSLL